MANCRTEFEPGSGFGRFLAAKIEFSYRAWQTVNLLALRLQWFESTPTHTSPPRKLGSPAVALAKAGGYVWQAKPLLEPFYDARL